MQALCTTAQLLMVHEQIDAAVSVSSTSGDGVISSTLDSSGNIRASSINVGYTIEWRHLLRALGESVLCRICTIN